MTLEIHIAEFIGLPLIEVVVQFMSGKRAKEGRRQQQREAEQVANPQNGPPALDVRVRENVKTGEALG